MSHTENEFSVNGYAAILKAARKSGYAFLAFDDADRFTSGKACLLRHDIDADLEAARDMAIIEADLGIKATYFLMLRSPVYNLFGRANSRLVHEIIAAGHWIGLHYDEGFNPGAHHSLQQWVSLEAGVIEKMFNVSVKAVSFHQPSVRILNNESRIEGFINTYDPNDLRGFKYISDSNKVWKEHPALEIFERSLHAKLHLLIHPMWWMIADGLSTEKIWEQAILRNWERSQRQILETERAYGKERKFEMKQRQ